MEALLLQQDEQVKGECTKVISQGGGCAGILKTEEEVEYSTGGFLSFLSGKERKSAQLLRQVTISTAKARQVLQEQVQGVWCPKPWRTT